MICASVTRGLVLKFSLRVFPHKPQIPGSCRDTCFISTILGCAFVRLTC